MTTQTASSGLPASSTTVPSMRHIAGSGVGIGVAAGLGLGVLTSTDSAVGSEGAGAGVPVGVGLGVGGRVSAPTCGAAEPVSVGVALDGVALGVAVVVTAVTGRVACWSNGATSAIA